MAGEPQRQWTLATLPSVKPSAQPTTWRLVLLLLGLAPVFSSCNNCVDAGLCRVAPRGGAATAFSPTASYAPGTTWVKLEVQPINIAPGSRLVLGTTHPVAKALGSLVIATFDGGRVRVTWDGRPFTEDSAYIAVMVAGDARVTRHDPARSYSTTMQTYIQQAGSTTRRAGSVTHGILVNSR